MSVLSIGDIPKSERTRTAIYALKNAMAVDTPESRFLFAIIECAIRDVSNGRRGDAESAYRYLSRPKNWHAELVGIDTEYMHRVLKELLIMEVFNNQYKPVSMKEQTA